ITCCRAGRRMASPHTSLHLNCHRIRPWSYSATSLGCTSHLSSGTGPHHSWMPGHPGLVIIPLDARRSSATSLQAGGQGRTVSVTLCVCGCVCAISAALMS
uniref:Uncharacterized protein n=2 Tax=Oreochromis TaxID=8139 RepID=A0A669C354_ORENI